MWSSDSDFEMLNMLSDWSDLSSDDDFTDATQEIENSDDCTTESMNDDLESSVSWNKVASYAVKNPEANGVEVLFDRFRCNVCDGTLSNFRYTCVQCSDFDLCSTCETNRAHDHHYVLRVPVPRPFAEIQFVLSTIRTHLMKKLDPITGYYHGDDDWSVKSEIKTELYDNDDNENNGDVEDNSDEECKNESSGSDDNSADDEGNDGHGADQLVRGKETLDVTTNRPKSSPSHRNEVFDSIESDTTITIKEEPENEYLEAGEDSISTDVAVSAASSTAKRKTTIRKQTGENSNDSYPDKRSYHKRRCSLSARSLKL